ncbi:hypothetical protein [Vibrio agarivorans]|uniref:hypothetical protein n=1 Tax=Vibrio agarivorans TaxID=153622 RepID=UPI0025B44368|nr:hypothetical protein [Vibrio agarivorans]MDN3661140.1 hypothetical protein [Vibrio agarivorans]
MERLLLSSAIALSSFSIHATELEVSFAYNKAFSNDSFVMVSSEVIGFYRSLAASNEFLAEQGANLTLIPAKVFSVDDVYYPEMLQSLQWVLRYGDLDAADDEIDLLDLTNDSAHLLVALSKLRATNGAVGYAVPFSISDYKAFDDFGQSAVVTKKVGIASGITNTTSIAHSEYLILHELLHSFGAKHSSEDAARFDDLDLGITYGHGEVCDSGYKSLMETPWDAPDGYMQLSGTDGCQSGNGDMVKFINTFAPIVAQHEPYLNMATLDMTAVEDTDFDVYTFTVTRSKNIDSNSTAYIHLSNTNPTVGNEIKPIEVSFAENVLTAEVDVSFAYIHPLFEDAQHADGMVYAVAVSESEVQPSLVDLTAINTAWTADDDEDNGGSTGGDSGGGSLGLFGLLSVGLIGLFRRKWLK